MSIEEIKLPDVGEDVVEVIEVSVSVGDSVEEDDAIIVVETEKASMDIPAPFTGKIESINISAGDKVSQGMVIATISTADTEEVSSSEEKTEAKVEETQVSSGALVDVFVPDIGGDDEVDVIEIVANIGDKLEEDDGIITLETEKATMDVPAPFAGELKEILVKAGDKVKTGTLIAKMIQNSTQTSSTSTQTQVQEKKEEVQETKKEDKKEAVKEIEIPVNTSGKVYASPSVRRLAREYGVDLSQVAGSGKKNRILKEDVRLFIKATLSGASQGNSSANTSLGFNLPPQKEIDFSKFGEIETVELTRIQKISGPSLHRNWVSMPHVTQFEEADITELENFRKEQNALYAKMKKDTKISPLVFVVKAVAKALQIHPKFNSSLSSDGQSLILKKYINIAVAVDTPNGLVVPVIKDVDKKGFEQIADELKIISQKARDGKLTAKDMQGACFTISSLGGIGGTYFTPIINAPEVAILGLSKSKLKPRYNGSEFVPKLMLPLSLSYDHRVIDGADGARFTTTLSQLLSDLRLILL